MSNFITNGNEFTMAIGLIYDNGNAFKDYTLKKVQPFIAITSSKAAELKKYLVDLVVYGEKSSCSKCEMFERLHSEFAFTKYVLREFSGQRQNDDISLNRCTALSDGFVPNYLLYKSKMGLKWATTITKIVAS